MSNNENSRIQVDELAKTLRIITTKNADYLLLEKENKRLRKALEVYGDESRWVVTGVGFHSFLDENRRPDNFPTKIAQEALKDD